VGEKIEISVRALVGIVGLATAVAGGGGAATSMAASAKVETKVERAESDISSQQRKIDAHEERLRKIEIDLAEKLASVKGDLGEIKRALGIAR
jgi:galactitol-specific phosphotransferase system IIB component